MFMVQLLVKFRFFIQELEERKSLQIWYRHPNSEAGNDEIQNVNMDFYFVGITF
jgi:hypothetical protein